MVYKQCNRCVMDTTDSRIEFSNDDFCSNCISFYRDIKPNWDKDMQDEIKFTK